MLYHVIFLVNILLVRNDRHLFILCQENLYQKISVFFSRLLQLDQKKLLGLTEKSLLQKSLENVMSNWFLKNFDFDKKKFVLIFAKTFNFWQKFQFLAKNQVLTKKINVDSWQKIQVLKKKFNFWQQIQCLTNNSIFDKYFDFWQKINFRQKFQKSDTSDFVCPKKWIKTFWYNFLYNQIYDVIWYHFLTDWYSRGWYHLVPK